MKIKDLIKLIIRIAVVLTFAVAIIAIAMVGDCDILATNCQNRNCNCDYIVDLLGI